MESPSLFLSLSLSLQRHCLYLGKIVFKGPFAMGHIIIVFEYGDCDLGTSGSYFQEGVNVSLQGAQIELYN